MWNAVERTWWKLRELVAKAFEEWRTELAERERLFQKARRPGPQNQNAIRERQGETQEAKTTKRCEKSGETLEHKKSRFTINPGRREDSRTRLRGAFIVANPRGDLVGMRRRPVMTVLTPSRRGLERAAKEP